MAPPYAAPTIPITGSSFVGGQPGPAFATGPQGSVGLQVVDVTLSSAQILALLGTAVNIIPVPNLVGFMNSPTKIIMRLLAGSAAYTDVGGAVSFAVGSLACALASNAIFLVTTTPNRRIQVVDFAAAAVGVGVTGTAGNPPTEDNAAMTISKVTNNFAAGNGTMHITAYYTVEPST